MAKFKVGDRVRQATDDYLPEGWLGRVGTVVRAPHNEGGDYEVVFDFKTDDVYYRVDSELELVEEPKKQNILQEADSLTAGDRGADYGHPEDDYAKTGMIWGALLHKWSKESAASNYPIPVPPELACLMMVGVKLSREVNRHKRDNLVDGSGYFRCVEMIHERKGHAPPT